MSDKLTHIGNFRLERELFRDERRVVYQGWQATLNRPVQLTQLTSVSAADTTFVSRWKTVARDLRDPGHPQFPAILEPGFAADPPYLVESYIIGDTLADGRELAPDLRTVARLFDNLADALAYAHRRGWAHGGLQPELVRLLPNGNAYLIDLPWQAAQRAKGDAAAMRADVQTLAHLFLFTLEPMRGPLPGWTGEPRADEAALEAWLAAGDGDEETRLAAGLAPLVLAALGQGDMSGFGSAVELGVGLRPLVQGTRPTTQQRREAQDGTIIGPPPGAPPGPPPPAPQYVTPQPYAPPPPPGGGGYQTPSWPQPPPPPPKRSFWPLLLGAGALVGILLVAGVILCNQGVLPFQFCVRCNESLVATYVSNARRYIERVALDDAQREIDSARAECTACGNDAPICSVELPELVDEVDCLRQTTKLVDDAQASLANDDSCSAVASLQEATKANCGDTKVAESLLASGRDGAYVQCVQTLLPTAAQEPDSEDNEADCARALGYLKNAKDLKSADPQISGLLTRAERYAALRKALEDKQWPDSVIALNDLRSVVENNQYCGHVLDRFEFKIQMELGRTSGLDQKWMEACQYFERSMELASTMIEKNDAGEALAAASVYCEPTKTPTPTLTPTPEAAVATVGKDGVNMRNGPATTFDLLRKANQGERFGIICSWQQSDGVWYRLASLQEGWLRGDLIQLSGSPPSCLPTTVPATRTPTPVDTRSRNTASSGWCAKPVRNENLEAFRSELVVFARDASGNAIKGMRIDVFNPFGGSVTLPTMFTDSNGAVAWAAVNPVEWKVCLGTTCMAAPFVTDKAGQRVILEFRSGACK